MLLHRAIQSGNIQVFRTLIKLGADVDVKGPHGIDTVYLPFFYHFKAVKHFNRPTCNSGFPHFKWENIALNIIKKTYVETSKNICKENLNKLRMPSLVCYLLTDSSLNWRLTRNCPNIHKMTPLYLAHYFKYLIVDIQCYQFHI